MKEASKMTLKELKSALSGCSKGSLTWDAYSPEYERRRPDIEDRRSLIRFLITTSIALLTIAATVFSRFFRFGIEFGSNLTAGHPSSPR
jgi:hypothetical protein